MRVISVDQSRHPVHQLSSSDEKIALFRSLFRGRDEFTRVDLRGGKPASPDTHRPARTSGYAASPKSRASSAIQRDRARSDSEARQRPRRRSPSGQDAEFLMCTEIVFEICLSVAKRYVMLLEQ